MQLFLKKFEIFNECVISLELNGKLFFIKKGLMIQDL